MTLDRKSELVALATNLIAERGYDSFSYADLTAASGLTKPSVHHHFRTKEDLGIAVIEAWQARRRTLIDDCHAFKSELALDMFLRSLTNEFKGSVICPLASLQAQFVVLPPKLQEKLNEASRQEIDAVSQLLNQFVMTTRCQLAMPAPEAARVLMSSIKGALLYGRTEGENWLPALIPRIMNLLLLKNDVM
jgi:TetR/AcrR family transcriptional repressor of nem operon